MRQGNHSPGCATAFLLFVFGITCAILYIGIIWAPALGHTTVDGYAIERAVQENEIDPLAPARSCRKTGLWVAFAGQLLPVWNCGK